MKGGRDFAGATTNPALIREWWRAWPDANVGIPTGQRTNLFVVDLDVEGDHWAQADFLIEHAVIGAAVIVGTGSGGKHYWFSRPEVASRLSHGRGEAPFGVEGIHVRCDGGLVVVPPSRNATGAYRLLEADFEELYPPHAQLVQMLLARPKRKTSATGAIIHKGARNTTLTSYAGTMRDRGMTEGEIAAALSVVNEARCRPPLPQHEVRAIATSVAGYSPTRPAGAFVEVPVGLMDDDELDAWARNVYIALARYADWRGPNAGRTDVGVPRLASVLQVSEATVRRGLRKLRKAGWIGRDLRGACRTAATTVHRDAKRP